jgi:tyrosine-protein kinase Etk/Wzc
MENYEKQYNNEEEINLQEWLLRFVRQWKWFVLSVVLLLAASLIYLRYAPKIYEVNAALLLKDEKKGGGSELMALQELNIFEAKSNVDNEIEILKTANLMEKVVREMDIYFEYYMSGRVRTSEVYGKDVPLRFWLPSGQTDSVPAARFKVIYGERGALEFKGEYADEDFLVQSSIREKQVDLPFGSLLMEAGASEPGTEVEVKLRKPLAVARDILSDLEISLSSKTTTVVNLKLRTVHPRKGVEILEHFVEAYNRDNMEDQNLVAQNTALFLDERLDSITIELARVEQQVERYKQSQELTDISSEAQLFLQQSSQNEAKRLELETQLSIVQDLQSYLEQSDNADKLLPALGLQSQGLNNLINEYNTLLLQQLRLRTTASEDNKALIDLNRQLSALASNVKASLGREKRNLDILLANVEQQARLYSSKITSIPRQEREFMEIQRQQAVKAELYLFLLQKKEENALSMILVIPKAKVIDRPRSASGPVSPRRNMIFVIALLLGLGLPVMIIVLREYFKFYIENKAELEKLSQVPVLGEIPRSQETGNIVLHQHSTNTLAEMFRLLRSNLLFVLGKDHKKVILISSSVGGEGKTFMSINLGLSLAFLNKKVLIMGLDVRKPKLAEYLGLDTKSGISLYLSGHSDRASLLKPSGVHPLLDVVAAGPIPPNPNELLASKELDELIEQYRQDYDYIILDSAPVGAVSDAYQLNRFADACLYVVRAEYTPKQSISEAEDIYKQKKLNNMYFLLNGSDIKKAGYRYGYSKKYGYGYGYGYGKE